MNNSYQAERMAEEHQKDLRREAELQRLVKQAVESRPRSAGRYDLFIAWIGRGLEQAGHRLQENHPRNPCDCEQPSSSLT